MLTLISKRLELPYPIVFVIGGIALVFVPHAPSIQLRPDWIFTIILPPLLFAGGWTTDWKLFRDNLRPITLLAIGLVVMTTLSVAAAYHALLPHTGWASALILGAIVSPPDAVAAGEIFERFSVPRRITAILEGEGLLNDATALVIYRFAVAAALAGETLSPQGMAGSFLLVATGGVASGVGLGYLGSRLLRWAARSAIADALVINVLFLLLPYAVYLSTDALGVSGVLATVIAGLIVSRTTSKHLDAESRIRGIAVWELLIFLLNSVAFLLIGLEVRTIVQNPALLAHTWKIGAIISLLVVLVRIAWVFPAAYLPRRMSARLRAKDPMPPWNYVAVIAWSGMRGIVSLAAALALPLRLPGGAAFPGRDEIIFVTFCVIFTTLVLQGLSLIPLIRLLGIKGGDARAEELEARITAVRAGLSHLRKLEPSFTSVEERETAERLVTEYEHRITHLLGHTDHDGGESHTAKVDHRLRAQALAAERHELLHLRDTGRVPDEIFRRLQYDLDLNDSRLQ